MLLDKKRALILSMGLGQCRTLLTLVVRCIDDELGRLTTLDGNNKVSKLVQDSVTASSKTSVIHPELPRSGWRREVSLLCERVSCFCKCQVSFELKCFL